MVGEAHHPHRVGPAPEVGRAAGGVDVGTGSHVGDPRLVEAVGPLREGLGPVVEGMVVGQRDAVDSEQGQHLDRLGRGPEEERFVGVGPPLSARRDAALEVEHEQVGGTYDVHQLPREQISGRAGGQCRPHPAAEHGVPGEGDGHTPGAHAASGTQRPTAMGTAASMTVPSPPQ